MPVRSGEIDDFTATEELHMLYGVTIRDSIQAEKLLRVIEEFRGNAVIDACIESGDIELTLHPDGVLHIAANSPTSLDGVQQIIEECSAARYVVLNGDATTEVDAKTQLHLF